MTKFRETKPISVPAEPCVRTQRKRCPLRSGSKDTAVLNPEPPEHAKAVPLESIRPHLSIRKFPPLFIRDEMQHPMLELGNLPSLKLELNLFGATRARQLKQIDWRCWVNQPSRQGSLSRVVNSVHQGGRKRADKSVFRLRSNFFYFARMVQYGMVLEYCMYRLYFDGAVHT